MNEPTSIQTVNPELVLERKCQKNEKNWYIFYTSPRAEKVVYNDLLAREYDAFLPVTKTMKVWKNRQKKIIEAPLFPSYIFVYTIISETYEISRIPKIATCVKCGKRPSIISSGDIDSIKIMLSLDQEVSVDTTFHEGELVRIVQGPLAGHQGILVEQKGKKRFGVRLKEINHTVFINVCTTILEKIE